MKFLLALSLLLGAASGLKMELRDHKNAPDAGGEWVSNGRGQDAQMADFSKYPPEKAAKLRATFQRLLEGDGEYGGYESNVVDGSQEYDDLEQAWRYLGMYVDCNPETVIGDGGGCNEDEEECDDDDAAERFMQEDHGSRDADNTCNRYVLYAVYIDPNYGGGGIGEYAFWDRYTQEWDTLACEESGTDCRKMDCHLPGTEFELLGFFKESSTRDFMDQLFKHEGYCAWFPDEYEFMQAHSEVWPEGCTSLNIHNLYMDLKPMPGGDWSIGVYTDQICTQEYDGSAMSVIEAYANSNQDDHASGNHKDDGDLLSLMTNMDYWNDAMTFWKQCNPCRTYNIGNGQDASDNAYDDDAYGGDDNARRRRRRRLQDDEDDQYTCNDDADYTNVNQCMKFYAKADMQVATFRNMQLASSQGTIVEVDFNTGQTVGSNNTVNAYFALKQSRDLGKPLIVYFYITLAVFVIGSAYFVFAWVSTRNGRGGSFKLEHPLVESEGIIA